MPNDNFSDLPWMTCAIALQGTDEVDSKTDKENEKILEWANYIGNVSYGSTSIPWCGLFVGFCVADAGIEPVDEPLWARNWAKFGPDVEPCYGAILVFSRGSGGHVGFYISEDDDYFHVLGGNQSDSVNVTKVAKDRLLASVFPEDYINRRVKGRIIKSFKGEVSTNEV